MWKTTFLIMLLAVGRHQSGLHGSDSPQQWQAETGKNSPKVPILYIILSTSINEYVENGARDVEVLLDAEDFSEKNLKRLFGELSDRFPTPDRLAVHVFTSLKQVGSQSQRDAVSSMPPKENPEFHNYHRALLMRIDGDELVRYNPNPPSREMKTMVLKGRDPFEPKK
jgi:hypothetical protein